MRSNPRLMQGVMLLEALIAILLFSIGILALIATQSTSVRIQADSNYRAEATLLAQQAIGMLSTNPAQVTQWRFNETRQDCLTQAGNAAAPAPAAAFLARVTSTLPNAELGRQSISVDASNRVTIRLCWRAPAENLWSNHVVTAVIE